MKLDTSHILTRSLLSVCYFHSALIETMKTLPTHDSICETYIVLSGVNSENIVTSSQITLRQPWCSLSVRMCPLFSCCKYTWSQEGG